MSTGILNRIMVITRSISSQPSSSTPLNPSGNCTEAPLIIIKSPEEGKFKFSLGNNKFAFIEYKLIGKNTYDLFESSVPDEYKGKGFGKLLAQKTFEEIISSKGRIKLTCTFLQDYYTKNPEKYKEYIVN